MVISIGATAYMTGFRMDYMKAGIIFSIVIGIVVISIGVWLGCQNGKCNFSPELQITVVVFIILVILGILGGIGYNYGTPIKNTLIGPNPLDKAGRARMDAVGDAFAAARSAAAGIADPTAAATARDSTYNKFIDNAATKALTDAKGVRTSRVYTRVILPLIILILFLIIIFFYVVLNVNTPFLNPNTGSSSGSSGYYTTIAKYLFIFIFVIGLIIGLIVYLSGNQSLKNLNEQIYNVKYVVFYILALIIFFTFTPSDIINSYSSIILPVSILLAVFIFYLSSSQKVVKNFNFNFERIRSMVLLFCLTTILIIYSVVNPGNYINEYFGYSSNITIAISTFALLYLIILFSFQSNTPAGTKAKSNNFLNNFTNISSYGSILFLIFVIFCVIFMSTYGKTLDKGIFGISLILIIIISFIWTLILGIVQFPEIYNKDIFTGLVKWNNFFSRILLVIFAIVIFSLIIFWINNYINNFTGNSTTSIVSLILNTILLLIVFVFIYKTINITKPDSKGPGAASSTKSTFTSILKMLSDSKSIISIIIVILSILLFSILFKVPNPFDNDLSPTDSQTEKSVIVIVSFVAIIFFICFSLLPSFKNIRELFSQISGVVFAIFYTLFLISFFSFMPRDILKKYAFIIVPITIIIAVITFYFSYSKNLVENFNFTYERIKIMILFFCLISVFSIYYTLDPGGYIKKYFGYSLFITILLSIFAFIYLLIILTLPSTIKNPEIGSTSSNFLDNFSATSTMGSILFVIFIIIVTIGISIYKPECAENNSTSDSCPTGLIGDKKTSITVIVLTLIICILWSVVLGSVQFPEVFNNKQIKDKLDFFKRSLLALFGIVISGLIIFWIVYNVQHFSGNSASSIISLILNTLLVLVVLGLIYKTINVQLPTGNSRKNAFFSLIINLIFYIPCLIVDIFDNTGKFLTGQYSSTAMGSVLMLIVTIILIVLYFKLPFLLNKFILQGGKQLVNDPERTDNLNSLGTYQELNGSDKYEYQYAISFWVYIDSEPPNTNSSYDKFTSLLNFGEKPNILYCGKTNTLMVTIQQQDLKKVTKNKLTDFDDNGNRILYVKEGFLLQKWNNIVINYSGGVLDIFLNGELVKSDIGVVPYYKIDNLTIGENNGISGGICNVVYFSQPLNTTSMYILYNMVKNKTPPVLSASNATILKENVNTTISSAKTVKSNIPDIPDIPNI